MLKAKYAGLWYSLWLSLTNRADIKPDLKSCCEVILISMSMSRETACTAIPNLCIASYIQPISKLLLNAGNWQRLTPLCSWLLLLICWVLLSVWGHSCLSGLSQRYATLVLWTRPTSVLPAQWLMKTMIEKEEGGEWGNGKTLQEEYIGRGSTINTTVNITYFAAWRTPPIMN